MEKQDLMNKLGYSEEKVDWYFKMAELIPVEDDGTVDGRKLHEVLGSKRQFADWIKQRIEKYEFVENVDYTNVHKFVNVNFTQDEVNAMSPQQRSRYGITTEYKLTVNMAKELSMIENNEVGKEFRKYFIMSEEIAFKMMEYQLEIEQYISSSTIRQARLAKEDRAKSYEVQSQRREIIDEYVRLINLLDYDKLTREQKAQIARVEALRELTGNTWVTR